MKKVQFILLMIIFSSAAFPSFAQEKAKWKEMEDFHTVMSTTFHPAEEDNLQPLKEKAGDLLAGAQNWQKSVVPVGFKADVTKPILKRLVKECHVIKNAVGKKQTDTELKAMITKAHGIFHEIMEKCRE